MSRLAALAVVAGLVLAAGPASAHDSYGFGAKTYDLTVDGRARRMLVNMPNAMFTGARMPLIVALHGTGSSPEGMVTAANLYRLSETAGAVIVAPQALGAAFNDGSGRGGPASDGVDDVRFIEAAIEEVRGHAPIDPQRIYLVGFSSGASMAQRFLADSAYPVAAVAAPADGNYAGADTPKRPRPLLLFWGTADKLNPLGGGPVTYPQFKVTLQKPALQETAARWAGRFGCTSDKLDYDQGVTTRRWTGCAGNAEVEFHLADDLGHHWPGGRPTPIPASVIGPYRGTPDLTDMVWRFFSRHPLPQ